MAWRLRSVLPPGVFRSLYGVGRLGYLPNYRRPRTFNEKVTWWIRENRDARLSQRADKLAVRDFVSVTTPWVRLPELYAVAESAENFPFDALPDVSVLKANHGWHQFEVLRRPFDVERARSRGAHWLTQRHGSPDWEWHFQSISPRLYAEQFLGHGHSGLPVDYKIMVFNGHATYIQVFLGRSQRLRRVTFDRDWQVLPIHRPLYHGGPPDVVEPELHPPRPNCLPDMLRAAEALAEDFPFVRADFYVVDDEPYFGELTYFPAAGYVPFPSPAIDRAWGERLDVGPTTPARRSSS